MNEQEEFEFRLRLEREQAGGKAKQPRPDLPVGMQTMADMGGAIWRGAGSIGSTFLAPMDMLNAKLTGRPLMSGNQERREGMDAGLAELGVNTNSLPFKGTKLLTEIAGTAAAGPALAGLGTAALTRAAPALLPKAAPLLDAIGTAGMRAGGVTGKAGMGLRTAGGGVTGAAAAGLVNPQDAGTGGTVSAALPGALKVAGAAGNLVGKAVPAATKSALGLSTGVGADAIGEAFRSGKAGKAAFLDNMRGNVPVSDVLDSAKQGLQTMGAAKAAQYRSGMIPIKGDQTVLSLGGIDQALQDAASVATFNGQVKNASAASAVSKMKAAVDEWRQLDPAQFHTPEGLDALKQRLGGIIESIPFEEKTARLAAGKVYKAAKVSIEQQAPTYAKVMKDYADASQLISEIERTLSLKPNASVDTAMRKLQSLMRNNVQTNYGQRLSLAKELEQKGGVDLLPSIAGQAMSSVAPRSLSGQIGGGATALMSMQNPLMLSMLPFQMPRVVGEAAYGLGRAAGGVSGKANALQQALAQNPQLAALMSNPNALSDVGQFAYRAAPALAVGR